MSGLEYDSIIKNECDKVCMKKGALNILEFLYVCKKIMDILVSIVTVLEEDVARMLVKISERIKKGGFILKIVLFFTYYFVSCFILFSLCGLLLSTKFDVYINVIAALIFAVCMTPLTFILKDDKNKK